MSKVDIYTNGNVITCEEDKKTVEAFAVKDGNFIAVGSKEEVMKAAGKTGIFHDLQGKTVVPGFFDSHVHFVQTGLNALAIQLHHCKTIMEVLETIKSAPKAARGIIRAVGFDESALKEKRYPTMEELDDAVGNRALWICRIDSHASVVNSMAFQQLELPEDTAGIVKDEVGRPTGVLKQEANSLTRGYVLESTTTEERIKAVKAAERIALAKGVTVVNALEGGKLFHDNDAEFLLQHKEELKIEVVLFYQTTDVKKVLEKGLKRIGGCVILDGSIGSRTAAVSEAYFDDPSTNGVLYFQDEALREFVLEAHRNGLQLTVHALGDRAIQQIIDTYKYCQEVFPRKDHRHRIEHFELATEEQIKEAAAMGLIVSMQPAFECFWGGADGMYRERLGEVRGCKTTPLGLVVKHKGIAVGGSDSDVTAIDPLLGIQGAVTHENEEHRVSPYEALKMFTIHGAYGVFQEDCRGSIKTGKIADFVVLEKNPLTTEAKVIKDIAVLKTYVAGEEV
ncbi:amidohydrolase [Natronincola peptidivorans]|uniref:amidohydrolase n=1 Tax=Natronincola peptidivorans TaxID=426128 RepID=UPI00147D4930|nr:amidohydrolase [Natronincola peptidivorans]